jgi:hypothetical protein
MQVVAGGSKEIVGEARLNPMDQGDGLSVILPPTSPTFQFTCQPASSLYLLVMTICMKTMKTSAASHSS